MKIPKFLFFVTLLVLTIALEGLDPYEEKPADVEAFEF